MYKLIIGVALTLFCLLTSCQSDEPATEEVLRPVRYVQVFTTGGNRQRSFSGAARSGVEANLSFKVSGTVLAVPIKVGDKVRMGQLIAYLDPKDYQLQVQQAEAALNQAGAGLQKANADYERVRGLYENNNASKSDLDGARASSESIKAAVKAAEKQHELARLHLSYTRLKAPASGSIASVHIEANENVMAGQSIIMLTSGSEIEVDVAIPEILIAAVKQGSRVQVTFDAIPDKKYNGIVREVGITSTAFATTYPATVRLTDTGAGIRSGMAAEVTFSFQSGVPREQITIPSVAVGEDRQGRFVFVVEPTAGDTAFTRRVSVQLGEFTADGLEILSGLADGDLIVTAGVSKIKDGQKVKL